MPIVDPFDPPRPAATPRRSTAPTAVQGRRLQNASTGETIESANVNQAQGRTALAVDTAVVPADIARRRADSTKAEIGALEANLRARTPGGFAVQDERQTAFNYKRLKHSEARVLAALKKDPTADAAPLWPELANRIPMVGDIVANAITDPERRIVNANRVDMLDAALWLATGAAYNKEQMRNLNIAYFPQVNDDAATRRDKAGKVAELVAEAKARAAMGLAVAKPDGTPQQEPEMTEARARVLAQVAIASGKNRAMVLKKMKEMGYSTTGL